MSEPPATPSYGELAALVAEQAAQLAEQAVLIEALRVELEALRRQAGPGLLELLAAAEHRRARREGQSEGGQARGWPAGRAVTAATAIRGGW